MVTTINKKRRVTRICKELKKYNLKSIQGGVLSSMKHRRIDIMIILAIIVTFTIIGCGKKEKYYCNLCNFESSQVTKICGSCGEETTWNAEPLTQEKLKEIEKEKQKLDDEKKAMEEENKATEELENKDEDQKEEEKNSNEDIQKKPIRYLDNGHCPIYGDSQEEINRDINNYLKTLPQKNGYYVADNGQLFMFSNDYSSRIYQCIECGEETSEYGEMGFNCQHNKDMRNFMESVRNCKVCGYPLNQDYSGNDSIHDSCKR